MGERGHYGRGLLRVSVVFLHLGDVILASISIEDRATALEVRAVHGRHLDLELAVWLPTNKPVFAGRGYFSRTLCHSRFC